MASNALRLAPTDRIQSAWGPRRGAGTGSRSVALGWSRILRREAGTLLGVAVALAVAVLL